MSLDDLLTVRDEGGNALARVDVEVATGAGWAPIGSPGGCVLHAGNGRHVGRTFLEVN